MQNVQLNADEVVLNKDFLSDVWSFIEQYLPNVELAYGESLFAHAQGIAGMLQRLGLDDQALRAAALYVTVPFLANPEQLITNTFGEEVFVLIQHVRKLLQFKVSPLDEKQSRTLTRKELMNRRRLQVESLRKLLLVFSKDVRVVVICLAIRLQILRYFVAIKKMPEAELARETLDIYAPLANRLGIWQLKWELEDLAFRFENPDMYSDIARLLDERRTEREDYVFRSIATLVNELKKQQIKAQVTGRPKHIYSIWKKMSGKSLDFSRLYDVRALRVLVEDVKDCYAVLGVVHYLWQPIPKEFDDYISHPKPNGYQSLHTVVLGEDGRTIEVQIRTLAMHDFAESGLAAHWRYKEAGTKGYKGQTGAVGAIDQKINWLRQLLAWKGEVEEQAISEESADGSSEQMQDDHIYVLTPEGRVIALPQSATPIDFAYHLHTQLGHRCRGARVDGVMVPLNTPLKNAQTVEIITVKEGSPSRDWLNPQLGFLRSQRARQKVRAWFNTIDTQENIFQGRQIVEKILQREGKTSISLDQLATKLGFKQTADFFLNVAKGELSAKQIESALSESAAPVGAADEHAEAKYIRAQNTSKQFSEQAKGILVVGVDALMTNLARCCCPAPPDEIGGFVTRGYGISIHRKNCATFLRMFKQFPERLIETTWAIDVLSGQTNMNYVVYLVVDTIDRFNLLRDMSEVFAREKMNVVGLRTEHHKEQKRFIFKVEVGNTQQLKRVCTTLMKVKGVIRADRK